MKNIIFYLGILLTLFAACDTKDEKDILPLRIIECVERSQNSNWITENFKNGHTIQFRDNFEGAGMIGFEGNTFQKRRMDGKVVFTYNYCTNLHCSDFGDALAEPGPDSILSQDKNGDEVVLDSKKGFCVDGEIEGILYYNTKPDASGKYFMKQGTKFLEGVTIHFDNTEYQEVENILITISEVPE